MSAIHELVGHAKRVAEEQAQGKSGRKYAAAIISQAETFRVASTLLEAEAIRALVRDHAEKPKPPPEAP